MPCSICGAVGVNSTTCPHNPNGNHSSPKTPLHNKTPLGSASGMAVMTKPVLPKLRAPTPAAAVLPAAIKPVLPKLRMPEVAAEKPVLPKPRAAAAAAVSQQQMQELEADMARLAMPSVPVKYNAISPALRERCAGCLQRILTRTLPQNVKNESQTWYDIHKLCEGCAELIATQYQDDLRDNRKRYQQYHRNGSNIELRELSTHGPKGDFFNATMYDGARYWAELGKQRAISRLPTPPSHLSK